MYKKILVATDGSPTADLALRQAAKLIQGDTKLLVLTVVDNPTLSFASPYGISYDIDAVWHALREQGAAVIKHTQEQLQQLGIQAETRLIDLHEHAGHDIPTAIEAEANAWGADLIVIGTHGRRGFRHLLLGSVAEHLMRLSSHPVLLVRAPQKT